MLPSPIKKLLRGDVGLPKTYWLFGVLGNVLLLAILQASIYLHDYIFKITYLIGVIYSLLIAIAVWNSSNRYLGNKIWKYLAKLAILIPILIGISSQFKSITSTELNYLSTNECIFKELKNSPSKNTYLSTNKIAAFCNIQVSKNIESYLGNSNFSDYPNTDKGYMDKSQALFNELIRVGKLPIRESFDKKSECVYVLTKDVSDTKDKEAMLSIFADLYCQELVAFNLAKKRGYNLYGAIQAGYNLKEISEYLESEPIR